MRVGRIGVQGMIGASSIITILLAQNDEPVYSSDRACPYYDSYNSFEEGNYKL